MQFVHKAIENHKIQPLCRSRSFRVTNVGTDVKPVCDFLCVNNSNLRPTLHCFRDMADY